MKNLKKPLISVVIPTYNSVRTLDRAIQSVFVQTFRNWHLIVVDDASTDGTLEWVRGRYSSDERVTILANTVNLGPAVTRNLGFDHATGEWITLLDSDDAWAHDRLTNLQAACEEYDFLADGLMTYDAAAMAESGPLFEHFDSPRLTLNDLILGLVGKHKVDAGYLKPMMRTSFLRRSELAYNCTLRHGEDLVFYCEALCRGARFGLLNGNSYIYTTPLGRLSKRSSPHSHTKPDPTMLSDALYVLSKKYMGLLTLTESAALDSFAKDIAGSRWVWEYGAARNRRDYLLCLHLMLRHWSVVRDMMRSLVLSLGNARTSRASARDQNAR